MLGNWLIFFPTHLLVVVKFYAQLEIFSDMDGALPLSFLSR